MLLWSIGILAILCFLICKSNILKKDGGVAIIALVSFIIFLGGLVAVGIIQYKEITVDKPYLEETYAALHYKIDNRIYDKSSSEIIDEIRDWNKRIKFSKQYQDNFWIGVFIPNIYEEFELIEYSKVK